MILEHTPILGRPDDQGSQFWAGQPSDLLTHIICNFLKCGIIQTVFKEEGVFYAN